MAVLRRPEKLGGHCSVLNGGACAQGPKNPSFPEFRFIVDAHFLLLCGLAQNFIISQSLFVGPVRHHAGMRADGEGYEYSVQQRYDHEKRDKIPGNPLISSPWRR